MKLATRMWLFGALVPCAVLSLALFMADRFFHFALEQALDQGLLAQAAVETGSLFDRPKNEPHLHMATSPLVDSVRPFAPQGVLFGPDGEVVTRYPPLLTGERERLPPGVPGRAPVLSTLAHQGIRERQLTVSVLGPDRKPYTLRLTATLGQLDAAARTFRWLALSAVLMSALVLLSVQAVQARALRRRLFALSSHVEALRAGELERTPKTDLTGDELSALRDVLAQATESLRSARDARDRLVADAAHELRTPLTLMRTSLDLALRRERSVAELREALHDTREEVDRLSALATSLLDVAALARSDAELSPCDLTELARAAVERSRAEASSRRLALTVEGPDTCSVRGRPEPLRRAIDNLLANAFKYARTRVEVRIEALETSVLLSVHDDGPGIVPSERELVFEPFHRLPGSAPGAGLGLTIVREVAKSHGGRAFVRDADVGADVVLELPSTALMRS